MFFSLFPVFSVRTEIVHDTEWKKRRKKGASALCDYGKKTSPVPKLSSLVSSTRISERDTHRPYSISICVLTNGNESNNKKNFFFRFILPSRCYFVNSSRYTLNVLNLFWKHFAVFFCCRNLNPTSEQNGKRSEKKKKVRGWKEKKLVQVAKSMHRN